MAPVKEPLRWPKSSLSINSEGIAPQLTGMKGPSALCPPKCKAFATNSLPVPVSPVIKAVDAESAKHSTNRRKWMVDSL
jgi:hypothetical protein